MFSNFVLEEIFKFVTEEVLAFIKSLVDEEMFIHNVGNRNYINIQAITFD